MTTPTTSNPHYSKKEKKTFPLTASTKVLSRTCEATTLIEGKKFFAAVAAFAVLTAVVDQAQRLRPQHKVVRPTGKRSCTCSGYLGAGCLSLPFAVSQLGNGGGILGIFSLSYLTSDSCQVSVKKKE